jgi:hypothetical protein
MSYSIGLSLNNKFANSSEWRLTKSQLDLSDLVPAQANLFTVIIKYNFTILLTFSLFDILIT